jgi:hypothetical protein
MNAKKLIHSFGYVVVVGLLIEVEIELLYPSRDSLLLNIASILASVIVGIGVWGEVHFSGRLSKSEEQEREKIKLESEKEKRESDEKISEANARAEDAKLETEKLRVHFSPRILTIDPQRGLQSLKGKVGSLYVTSAGGVEPFLLAFQIVKALQEAEIDVTFVTKQQTALFPISGAAIIFSSIDELVAMTPLMEALKASGIPTSVSSREYLPMPEISSDATILVIGEKELMQQLLFAKNNESADP